MGSASLRDAHSVSHLKNMSLLGIYELELALIFQSYILLRKHLGLYSSYKNAFQRWRTHIFCFRRANTHFYNTLFVINMIKKGKRVFPDNNIMYTLFKTTAKFKLTTLCILGRYLFYDPSSSR